MPEYSIEDDHPKDTPKNLPIVEDYVQPRIQHDRLPSNHHDPTDGVNCHSKPLEAELEMDDDTANRIWHDSCRSDQKQPKV
jgi:hypothetical protein